MPPIKTTASRITVCTCIGNRATKPLARNAPGRAISPIKSESATTSALTAPAAPKAVVRISPIAKEIAADVATTAEPLKRITRRSSHQKRRVSQYRFTLRTMHHCFPFTGEYAVVSEGRSNICCRYTVNCNSITVIQSYNIRISLRLKPSAQRHKVLPYAADRDRFQAKRLQSAKPFQCPHCVVDL